MPALPLAQHPTTYCAMQEPLSKQLAAHLPKWAEAEQASSAGPEVADVDRHREKIEKLGAGLLLVYACLPALQLCSVCGLYYSLLRGAH